MIRSFFSVMAVGIAGLAFMPAFLEGCQQTGVGDPCTPEQEYDTTFLGFAFTEVNVESKSFQCQTRLCLVNHFQGRVSCPYGQDANGKPPGEAANGKSTPYLDAAGNVIGSCGIPGSQDNADGTVQDPQRNAVVGTGVAGQEAVPPQCLDRTAADTVYCSCRCANVDGQTNDGSNYCSCPDGYACTQLVTSIGQGDTGLTGAYCVKNNTVYNTASSASVCSSECDPTLHNCG